MAGHFLIMRRLAGFFVAYKAVVCPFLTPSPGVSITVNS